MLINRLSSIELITLHDTLSSLHRQGLLDKALYPVLDRLTDKLNKHTYI